MRTGLMKWSPEGTPELSLTLRALGKTLSNEGHGFSRAVKVCALDGFTGCGKTHVLYQGTTLVVP